MATFKHVSVCSMFVALVLASSVVMADGPKGFRADWKRAETAATDAVSAARTGDIDAMRSDSDAANDALLDLAAYAESLPNDQRGVYTRALDDARVAAQRVIQSGAIQTKEDGLTAAQATLNKVTAVRQWVPGNWLHPDVCSGMRKQRRHC